MSKALLKNLRKLLTLFLTLFLLLGSTLNSLAATLSVDTMTDTGAAGCELREAVNRVNAGSDGLNCLNGSINPYGTSDTINFASPGTIVLNSGELNITKPVIIDGPTPSGSEPDVTIDANGTGRVLNIDNPDDTTVEINNVTLTNGSAASGGLAFLHNGTAGHPKTLNLNGVNLDGGVATVTDGGALHAGDNNVVNLTDTEVSNSTAYNGGGVYVGAGTNLNVNATGTIFTDSIHNNSANNNGGGIYVESTGTAHIGSAASTIELIRNTALNSGGAIHYNGSGTSTITNSRFKRNIATTGDGGAVSNYGTDLSIDSSSFGNADTLNDRNISSLSEGGAIFSIFTGNLNIQNSDFYGNRSDAGGGAIKFSSSGNLTVGGTRFVSNQSVSESGGGISFASITTGDLNIQNSTFRGNQSDAVGGAINFSSPGTLTVDGTNFVSNHSLNNSGGAVYIDSAAQALFNTVTFGGSGFFDSNTAGVDGGAIYSTGVDLTLNGVDFQKNSCSGNGGAVNFIGGLLNRTLSYDTGTVTSNSSSLNGGAFNLSSDDTAISNVFFDQNDAQVSGGAISLGIDSALTLADDDFNLNHAVTRDGGAIFSDGTNTVNATNTTATGNHALGGDGGFLNMNGAANTVNLDGMSFTDNQASGGGAIYLGGAYNPLNPGIKISNSTFTNNAATTDIGGAICLNLGSMRLDNVDFNGNNALLDGGALFLSDTGSNGSTEIINGSDFVDNYAGNTNNGGAIYLNQSLFANSLSVTGSNFDLSNAIAGGGGAIHNENGTVTITDSSFSGAPTMNVGQGGAIQSTGGQLNINRCYIGQNDTTGNGGAIAVISGNLSLINSTVENNTATGNGGGIYLDSAGTADIISSTIAYNHSLGSGGGISASLQPTSINFQNSILAGNTAATTGPDCQSGVAQFSTGGFNLFSNTLNCGVTFQPTDHLNVSALLGALGLYGGSTLNYILSVGSPAINAGNTTETIDQRGMARPQGGVDDIGSHELQDITPPVISEVTPVPTPSTDTTPTYTFTSNEAGTITYGGPCTSATTSATVGPVTVTFDVLTPGTYSLCTMTVTDLSNNISNLLTITPFTIVIPPAPPAPPSGGGGSAQFGQPSCSGNACPGVPTPPTILPIIPPVIPPVTPPPSIPPVVTPPVTTPPSTGASSTPISKTGTNNIGGLPRRGANPILPPLNNLLPVVQPVSTVIPTVIIPPAATTNPTLRSSADSQINANLVITTPTAGLKSADDTPFIFGQGPANTATSIYLFDSRDFDEIRNALQKSIDEKYPQIAPEQKAGIFQQQFTYTVISILNKYIRNNLDPKNPLEAKFLSRVLDLGTAITGSNKLFLLDSNKKLRDNVYLLVAYQNDAAHNRQPIFSREIQYTVDSTLSVLTPEITTLGGKTLSSDALIGNLRVEIDPGNLLPTLVGRIKQPSKIIANWQSDIVTSALIADSLAEEFRLSAPSVLAPGDHTVYVTAYRRSDNAQSKTLKINFHISETSPLEILNYWWILALVLLFTGLFFLRKKKSPSAGNLVTAAAPASPTPLVPTGSSSTYSSMYRPYVPPTEHPATIFTPTSGPHSIPPTPPITPPPSVPPVPPSAPTGI